MKSIEELLQTPYWIIDILPKQVPKNSPGQFFSIDQYFREHQIPAIKQRHLQLILKLNCYYDLTFQFDEEEIVNPAPDQIAEIMKKQYVLVTAEDALIVSEPDDTYLTLFNAGADLLELIRPLAAGEGLMMWKYCEDPAADCP